MTGSLLRLATATALLVGLGGVALAQTYSEGASNDQAQFYALYGNRFETVDRTEAGSGTVVPSVSHTVMGLRVPR